MVFGASEAACSLGDVPVAWACALPDGVGALVLGAVAIVVARTSTGSSDGGEAAAAAPPVVGCAMRAERSVKRFARRRDVIRGPFALVTVARDLPRLSQRSYRPRDGRLSGVNLPVGLRVGHSATLGVAPNQRAYAALAYREETRDARRIQNGDEAVAFKPCPADTPAFDGGTVDTITGWAGALIIAGPRCVRLQVRVDGQRRSDIELPLGRRCR